MMPPGLLPRRDSPLAVAVGTYTAECRQHGLQPTQDLMLKVIWCRDAREREAACNLLARLLARRRA